MGLLDQTIRLIVTRTLFDVAARDVDIVATDAQISEIIRGSAQFQNDGGEFDKLRFDNFLRVAGYSEPEFVEILRQDLSRAQFMEAMQAGAAAPRALTETLLRYREERRVAEVLELRNADVARVEEPGDAEIDAYYMDHPREFTAPEYRTVTGAFLAPSDLAQAIVVAEEDIVEAFERRRGQFEEPERREIEQVVFAPDDEASARKLVALVAEGQDFAAAAAATDAGAPVDLGNLTRDELPIPELAEAAFALEPGTVSDPVASDFGWHVVHVRAVEPGVTKTLEDVRDLLANELALEQARADIFDVLNGVDDALAGGATVEDVARDSNMNMVRLNAVARNGSTRDGGSAEGLPRDPRFLATVFATPEGQESQVIESGNGGFFVIRVDRIIEPELRTLSDVRDQVIERWQTEQRRLRTEERAQRIAERIRGGEALAAIAEEFVLTVTTSEPFTRAGAAGAVSRATVSDLFTIDEGEVTVVPVPGGMQVARLVEIQSADISGDKVETLGNELAQAVANDLESQMAAALSDHYDISFDLDAIQNLFQSR